ncbi:MAG: glycosyltransferase [Opitutales bacterium]|nr:glycosyltransferase [Opitutales bacterium]
MQSKRRILLTSHGSTGDIYPVIRLGRELRDRGHDVRMATTVFFQKEVEEAGLRFIRLPPDWDQTGLAEAMRELSKARDGLDVLGKIYREAKPFIDEIITTLDAELADRTDLFVCSYVFSPMSHLARARGIPCAVTTFAHNVVPSPLYPPDRLPTLRLWPRPLQKLWNRFLWIAGERLVCWTINRTIGEGLHRHKVPPARGFFLDPADLALVTVSPALFEPAELWHDRFRFTGYLRWQAAEKPEMESVLNTFTGGQPVPILTFGSVTFEEARHVMTRFMSNWPKGKKIIVQSGWARLTIEKPGEEELVVGKMSHDQLFRHGSVIIHHGGAGTTASALHSGRPQIIIPHLGDQFFFADEIERLGVGHKLGRRRWPEKLPALVRKIEATPAFTAKARAHAATLAGENGPAMAAGLLEEMVRMRKTLSP